MKFLIEQHHLLQLHRLYSSPNRYYHNMNHVSNMITYLNTLMYNLTENWQIIASYYHDAIYNATQPDVNEEKSFQLFHNHYFESDLITPKEYQFVKDSILGTKLYFKDLSNKYDLKVLKVLDADLASLAEERNVYILNNKNIRKENSHLTDSQFKTVSIEFIQKMLKKDWIYNTPSGRAWWEEKARKNLEYALNKLEK